MNEYRASFVSLADGVVYAKAHSDELAIVALNTELDRRTCQQRVTRIEEVQKLENGVWVWLK